MTPTHQRYTAIAALWVSLAAEVAEQDLTPDLIALRHAMHEAYRLWNAEALEMGARIRYGFEAAAARQNNA